jgi:hypothetical protein
VSDDRTGPRLAVSAVAQRLGVAPSTLRTWDRRYGVGPTEHASGTHRRYGAGDLARLDTMRRLVLQGVPPREAARAALEGEVVGEGRPEPLPARVDGGQRRVPRGRVLPLPGADRLVRGLGRAAMALDGGSVVRTVEQQLGEHGVLRTWEDVLVPVLVAAGARWEATGTGVEVEHLLSDCVATALRRHAEAALASRPQRAARPLLSVLLACAPDEQHVLPLHALAAGLAEGGNRSRFLGAAVPAPALQAAVRRTGPAAVFVWAQCEQTGDPALLDGLPLTRPATTVVVGGPGWPAELPGRLVRVGDLGAALAELDRALRGQPVASGG